MSKTSTNCVFCNSKEIKEREIIRNKLVWAFPTNIPIVPGHVLICPIRCARTVQEMTDEELMAIFNLLKILKGALVKVFGAEGFNYAWNEGEIAGQSVPHFHLHLLPRKINDTGVIDYEPRKFLYRPGSREISPNTELLKISKLIKQELIK